MLSGLAGRVALVTGASRGIGRATAEAFAAEGARLVICGRRGAEMEEAAEELRTAGGEVVAVTADVTAADGVAAVVEAATSAFGRVDVLVNNVGGTPLAKLGAPTMDDWQRGFETTGVLSTCVVPGITRTEMIDGNLASAARASERTVGQVEEALLARVPSAMNRLGRAAEVADAIVFPASDRASWITGSCLTVDGGTLSVIP